MARKDTFYDNKDTFLKKGHQEFHPPPPDQPCSIPFLSVLHQNKALHNFGTF